MPAVSADLQQRFGDINALATLPDTAAELIQLLQDPDLSMPVLAGVIEKNPSLAAKLLKVANSAFWGQSGKIDTLDRALVVLGLRQVSNIVMAVSLFSSFAKMRSNPYFDRDRFWMHSIGTAQIARTLSTELGLSFHGEEFLAGLLHDIGRLLLDQFAPEEFREITRKADESGRSMAEVERESLGCDHADLGAHLLAAWNLPAPLVTAVEYHHGPELAPDHRQLTAVVHLADVLCELWGIGFDEDLKMVVMDELPAWKILCDIDGKLANLDLGRFTLELKRQMETAEVFMTVAKE